MDSIEEQDPKIRQYQHGTETEVSLPELMEILRTNPFRCTVFLEHGEIRFFSTT